MSKITFVRLVRSGLVIAVLTSAGLSAEASPRICQEVFRTKTALERVSEELRPGEEKLDYNNDVSYLREYKRASSDGLVANQYSERFQTRFYYSATGTPGRDGKIPLVDPQAKAIYVFIHGSGTMKSSGRNFKGLMNTLGQMGYSGISFDLPFHMDGPNSNKFYRAKDTVEWVHSIINEIKSKAPGRPVYLAGHSFGPDLIAEYVYRYPFSIQGGALLNPAGFDPILSRWYDQKTSKMKFGGDVAQNTLAGEWAGRVSQQFMWNRTGGKYDPTLVNPDLKLRMLSGNLEEYVPAPLGPKGLPSGPNTYDIGAALRKHLSRTEVSIENGIGHYIFDFRDDKGRNVVLRELLALDGKDSINAQQMIKDHQSIQKPMDELMAHKYAFDQIFRTWVDATYTPRTFQRALEIRNDRFLKKVETAYQEERFRREEAIRQRILKVAEEDPDFYQKYQKYIDEIRSGKRKGDSSLFPAFADYVEAKRLAE